MFWKLWKYEIKCSYRSYALMYGILLLSSVLISPNENFFNAIVLLVYGVMIMVTLIMTLVLIIRNYNHSMFHRPGYLTMTLPVSSKMTMGVKILTASIWFALSYIVVMMSALTLGSRIMGGSIFAIFDSFEMLFQAFDLDMFLAAMNMGVNLISMVALFYLILNFTHSSYVHKHRVIIAIAIYVIYNIILSFLSQYVFSGFGLNIVSMIFLDGNATLSTTFDMETVLLFSILFNLATLVLYYFGASYLLDHKLEIE